VTDFQRVDDLVRTESEDAALSLVREDLNEASKWKQDNWSAQTLRNRWSAFHGDPDAYQWPYRTKNTAGVRPVTNLTFIQIRHKIAKLTRPPVRLNVTTKTMDPTPEVRFALNAAKKRLEQKAKEANWGAARRAMARYASVEGIGIRAIGVEYYGLKPRIIAPRVRGSEFYFDPAAEPQDLLGTASWVSWRRLVSTDRVAETMRKFGLSPSNAAPNLDVEGDYGITLPDDQILIRGDFRGGREWSPASRIMVTDYYRRDLTMDVYYKCSKCGGAATVGRYNTGRTERPMFECQHCGKMETKLPDREQMRQGLRYPYGRHIRIMGAGAVVYNGPCKLELQDVFPFVVMPWYEDETPKGMSEVELIDAPQNMHNLAEAMLGDNAVYNTHPKRVVLQDSITKADNNDPGNIMEMTQEGIAAGGMKQLEPGQVGEAAKIILQTSDANSYKLAGNDPVAHGGAPSTIRSGVGIGRIVAASEVSLYSVEDQFFEAETRFYRILRDMLAKVDYPQEMFVRNDASGLEEAMQYDRMLMRLIADIEVTTEARIDQEREELYSRAVELKGLGDPMVDWEMLHELSGIPPDVWQRSLQRAASKPAPPGMNPIDQILPGATGGPPPLSVVQGGRGAGPAPGGGGPDSLGAGRLQQQIAGRNAPPQHTPPARSRGMQTPQSPAGGGGGY